MNIGRIFFQLAPKDKVTMAHCLREIQIKCSGLISIPFPSHCALRCGSDSSRDSSLGRESRVSSESDNAMGSGCGEQLLLIYRGPCPYYQAVIQCFVCQVESQAIQIESHYLG